MSALRSQVDSHSHEYPVGEVQTVLQRGLYSTASMSYVNVPGTSLTAVTPVNGRLLVTLSSEVRCRDNAPGDALPWCLGQVLVDGTPIQPDPVIFAAGDPDANASNSHSHQFVSAPLAGGQHTVQARYRVDDAAAVFDVDQTILTALPLAP